MLIQNKYKYEIFFIIGYGLILLPFFLSLTTLIENNNVSKFFGYIKYIGLYLFLIREILILINKNIKVNYLEIIGLLFIILSIIVFLNYQLSTQIIFFSILVYSTRNINYEIVFKIYLCIVIVFTCIAVLSSSFGLIEDRIFFRGDIIRRSLGFGYTTFISHILFFITLTFIALKRERFNFLYLCLFLALSYVIYYLTDSRNSFLLTCFAVIFFYLFNKLTLFRKICTKLSYLAIPLPIILFCLMYFLSKNYTNSDFFIILNKLFSGRLSLGYNALNNYGVSLFGQKIELFGNTAYDYGNAIPGVDLYNYIDCSYLQILILYGAIFFIALIFMYTKTLIDLHKVKNFYLFFGLIFLAVHATFDPQLIYIQYQPLILILGKLFSKQKYELLK